MKKVIFTFYLLICSMAVMYSQYVADGIIGEWDTTPIQSEPGVYPYFRFAERDTVLYWVVYAAQDKRFDYNQYHWLETWFDADCLSTTGLKDPWPGAGLDYLGQGTSLYYHTGTPGGTDWTYTMLAQWQIVRNVASDSMACEHSAHKSLFTKVPLGTTFGVSFHVWYKNDDKHWLPEINAGFSTDALNVYKIKNRTTLYITKTLDATDTITLDCKNAFYNPYMNDPDTDGYLNFQNGIDYTANPSHWASWGINLETPQIFDLRMTYTSTGAGQVSLSFVDMATNVVTKTFPAIDFSTNGTMSETKVFQIDASDIPAGYYMVVLKNSATDSNLKVQNLKLTKGTGAVSKWDNVPIQSEPGVYPYFRITDKNNVLCWVVYAAQDKRFDPNQYNWLETWFDSDVSTTTGYVGDYWNGAGIDYLIQGTSLYNFAGAPGSSEWNWPPLAEYSVVRAVSADSTTYEHSANKDLFSETPMGTAFGISFNVFHKEAEMYKLPALDEGFYANSKNIYKIKNRTTLDITKTLDTTDTITLGCMNAFYNPYMNDPDTDGFLNFQYGTNYTANPRHWASWGINLTPQKLDLRMTYTSTAAGQISLSLVNMATNAVVGTISGIDYSTKNVMDEALLCQIDLSGVPSGYYMVVLKNSATDSNLKVQNLKFTKATPVHVDEVQPQKDIAISVHNKQLTIESKSDSKISFSVYTMSGALISQMDNTNSATLHLERGAYILSVNNGGNVFSKKIMVL
jgi:hypothetical protein